MSERDSFEVRKLSTDIVSFYWLAVRPSDLTPLGENDRWSCYSEKCQWFVKRMRIFANLWPSSDKLLTPWNRFALAEPPALPEVFLRTCRNRSPENRIKNHLAWMVRVCSGLTPNCFLIAPIQKSACCYRCGYCSDSSFVIGQRVWRILNYLMVWHFWFRRGSVARSRILMTVRILAQRLADIASKKKKH